MLVAGKCEGAAAMHVMDNILTSLTAVTSVAGVTMIVMQVRRAALSIREACGLYMTSDAKLSDVANAARALSIFVLSKRHFCPSRTKRHNRTVVPFRPIGLHICGTDYRDGIHQCV